MNCLRRTDPGKIKSDLDAVSPRVPVKQPAGVQKGTTAVPVVV